MEKRKWKEVRDALQIIEEWHEEGQEDQPGHQGCPQGQALKTGSKTNLNKENEMERRKKAKEGIIDVMKMVQPQEYPNTSSSTRQTNISSTNIRVETTAELQKKGTNQLIETGFTSNGGGLVKSN